MDIIAKPSQPCFVTYELFYYFDYLATNGGKGIKKVK